MIRPMCLVLAGAAAASTVVAQPLNFRLETSSQPFTPLQSYVTAELGEQVLFFSGITGFGLHAISQPKGPAPIFATASDYNQEIVLVDQAAGTLASGSLAHLSAAVRNALLVTNAASFQSGDTLYIYGGYGPNMDETDVTTKAQVLEVDLVAVRDAIAAANPIPEAAFTLAPSVPARTTGAEIFPLGGDRFILYGGKIFEGDYPGHSYEEYKSEAYVFDVSVSATVPETTIVEEDPFVSTVMRRRDLNGQVATVMNGGGGKTYGFIVTGGVFRFSAIHFETPVSWMDGDTYATEDTSSVIKMNMYHGPSASFFSDSTGQNRIVLFGGITAYTSVASPSPSFFNPWSDTITENVFDGTTFVVERELGSTPNPISNGKLVYNTALPKDINDQMLLDQLPPNEIRLGSIFGGIHAAAAADAPATWASSEVLDVYVVKGVRGDITGNGVTDSGDLASLLASWGLSGVSSDLNLDGGVNAGDLAILLSYWGRDFPG